MTADLTALREAVRAVFADLEALPPREAFVAAGRLSEYLAAEAAAAAKIRAAAATHIRDSEQLSLAGLAEALGISKARAAQLVRYADS